MLPGFRKLSFQAKALGVISSIIPDADVLAFRYGIPYEHMLGHRGFTHSILFAIIWAWLLDRILFMKKSQMRTKRFLFFFLCTTSHGILDAMTTGGRGVGFLIPFSAERIFLPWRPILVSPMSVSRFFSEWGWKVIQSELIFIALPVIVMLVLIYSIREI